MNSKVALWKGKNRKNNIRKAMEQVEDDLKKKIIGKDRILLKPNCVSDTKQLASTHVDALRAILDFVSKYSDKKVIIAEGSAHITSDAYKNFGYYNLKDEYNVGFLDLNRDRNGFKKLWIWNSDGKKISVDASRTMLNSDCVISSAILKTHDRLIATLTLKNVVMGALKGGGVGLGKAAINKGFRIMFKKPLFDYGHKWRVHQDNYHMNKNIAELAKSMAPDIGIIDGFVGMEGNGPTQGNPVEMKVAAAGSDFLAVDWIGAKLMGFNPDNIGYLHYCKKMGDTNPEVVGNIDVEKAKKKFKPHKNYKNQLKWKI